MLVLATRCPSVPGQQQSKRFHPIIGPMCQTVRLCRYCSWHKKIMVTIAIVLITWELISQHVFILPPFLEDQQVLDSLEKAGSLQAGHPGPEC